MAYEQLLSALASSQSGSGYGNAHIPVSGGDIAPASSKQIAPIGINLGNILQPMMEGSPQNGGYGADLISRMGFESPYATIPAANESPWGGTGQSNMILYAAGAMVVLLVIVKMKGRR